ncbi:MAG: chemotaxis protein CheW [Bacteroidales bacterium]
MNNEKEILKERARKIAVRKSDPKEDLQEHIPVVEFLLAPERYAFPESYVSEVLFLKEITTIPGTPAFVMGIINLRGRIVSVVNLKSLFNLKERGLTELNKVMILKNDSMEFGVVADSILGNSTIDSSQLSAPPINVDNAGIEYISGVTPEGLILLNAERLLQSKQIVLNN